MNLSKEVRMKTYYYCLIACFFAVLLSGCKKEPKTTAAPELTVTPGELVFAASENEPKIIQVTGNVEWEYRPEEAASSWMTIEEVEEGLSVSVKDNISEEARQATIRIMPLAAELSIQTVTVKQVATDFSTFEITVSPETTPIAFEAVGNTPYAVEVAVTGDLAWNAIVNEGSNGWLHAAKKGSTLEISVEDNEWLESRSGTVQIGTVDDLGIEPVVLQVIQQAKPAFSIASTNITLEPYGGIDSQATIVVICNMGTWDAVVSATADGTVTPVNWLSITMIDDYYGSIVIEATENQTGAERTAYVVVSLDGSEQEPIVVTVTQKLLNTDAISTLTGPVNFTDMESGVNDYVYFTPTYPEDNFFGPYKSAIWEIDLWASSVERYKESYMDNYRGAGTRLRLYLRSEQISHNADGTYVLPEGSYPISTEYSDRNPLDMPWLLAPGEASLYGGDPAMRYPIGCWYMELDGENTYVETAPLTGGRLIVDYNETTGEYQLNCQFTDDRGNAITGVIVTKLDNLTENYTEL